MPIKYVPLAIALVALCSCAEPPVSEEQAFLDDVAAAMGGKENIEAATTLVIKAKGRSLNLGQDRVPETMTKEFDISDFVLTMDLTHGRSRTTLTRTPLFPYFLGQDPVRQTFGIDGDVAYDVGFDGSMRRAPVHAAMERRSTYYHHPLPLLQAALLGTATTDNLREENGLDLADITTSGGKVFTLAVNATTRLPAFIRSTDHHPYLRDVVRTSLLSDYKSIGAMMLPGAVSQSLDEFAVVKLEATSQEVNGPIEDTTAPPEVVAAPPPSTNTTVELSAEQIGEGVWFLVGRGYNSVLIEFSDHVMLVEAPTESHTVAALERARELVPDKAVTQLVNSHYHFDHSAGIRTAVAEGLTVLTHAANEVFYRRLATQPSTIVPDRLSQAPKDLEIEVFDEKAVYEEESMTVELYHLNGSPHTDALLMVYLPKQRVVIQGDAFTPGSRSPPNVGTQSPGDYSAL